VRGGERQEKSEEGRGRKRARRGEAGKERAREKREGKEGEERWVRLLTLIPGVDYELVTPGDTEENSILSLFFIFVWSSWLKTSGI
jgi:hypothetical protein